jgi:antitoxin Phd
MALNGLTAVIRYHILARISSQKEWPMAKRSWSVQDAKNRFSEVVEAARRTPQTVTKHGKPAVVVVDVVEYERLRHLERATAPSFADALLAMPQDNGEFPRGNVRIRDLEL